MKSPPAGEVSSFVSLHLTIEENLPLSTDRLTIIVSEEYCPAGLSHSIQMALTLLCQLFIFMHFRICFMLIKLLKAFPLKLH